MAIALVKIMVSLPPKNFASITMAVIQIAVEVREKAIAEPSGKPLWVIRGFRKTTSAPLQ